MRYIAAPVVVAILFAATARAGTPEPGYTDTLAASGLSQPTALAFMPDGRMLVTEKTGDLVLVDGGVPSTLVTIPVCASSEMGLLGIALDPDFTSNGFIYLYRTKQGLIPPCSGGSRFNEVVRVTMAMDDTVSIGSLAVLLTGIRTDNGNHDGGVLRIGPDDKLYVGVGDTGLGDNVGGPGSSTNPYAQDLNQLEGKVLRLELDGSVPVDNPFVGMPSTREEIFAYGFRNPFRMSFDDLTGSLWLGDVGDLTWEEIDIVTAGDNYSWEYCEANQPMGCAMPGDVAPVFVYPHSGGSSLGSCVIGGSFAGAAFGTFDGHYVFGDCTSNEIYRAALTGPRDDIAGTPALISSSAGTPSDFVTGPDGAVYYAANSGGEIRRLAQAVGDSLLGARKFQLRASPPDDTK
jgi:glucose/arabinose dehydrogenase